MPFVQTGVLEILKSSAWFVLFLTAAFGWGCFVTGGSFQEKRASSILLHASIAISLGLFFCSLWVLGFGMAGYLNRAIVFLFLAVGVSFGFPYFRRVGTGGMKTLARSWKSLDLSFKLLMAGLLALCAISFIATQAPPIGNDDLAYHLYFPRLHAEAGRIVHDALHPRSLWPFAMEMLFTAGLIVEGTGLAKLFGWVMAPLGLIAVLSAAARFMGQRQAFWAALIFSAIPAIWMQSLYAYVDLAVMVYAFLAFVALEFYIRKKQGMREAFVAGLLMAALVSVKIFSLIPLAVLLALTFFRSRKLLPFFIAALAASPWYIRSWILSGNPVFPFLADWFGGNGFYQRAAGFSELPRTASNFFLMPWNLTFGVETFGGEPVGCVLLAALPLLILLYPTRGLAQNALIFAVCFSVAWFFTIQHVRFIFAAFPFLALALSDSAVRFLGRPSAIRRTWGALFVALWGAHALLGAYYSVRMVPSALGMVKTEAYLEAHERSFAFFQSAKGLIPKKAKILSVSEPRLYYFPVAAIYESPLIGRALKEKGISFNAWLGENGVTHLLAYGRDPDSVMLEPYLKAYKTDAGPFHEIAKQKINAEDQTFYYSLWEVRS